MYGHVRKVMSHVVKHCPHKAVDDLEEISYLMKQQAKKTSKVAMEDFMKCKVVKAYAQPSDAQCA